MDIAIKSSLETWYPEDHPLHLDPLPAVLGLAGEAGKLVNLYKKERFKDGISWWDCMCGLPKVQPDYKNDAFARVRMEALLCECKIPIPKNLDALGGLWYYLRILAWQQKIDLSEWTYPKKRFVPDDMFMVLTHLNFFCAKLLLIYEDSERISKLELATAFSWFQDVLFLLDCNLDQLTELNYDNLKDGENNGWAIAGIQD